LQSDILEITTIVSDGFAENGYVIVDPRIPDATIEAVNESLLPLFKPNQIGYFSHEPRIQDAWTFTEHVK
jgi:hypothetical protein